MWPSLSRLAVLFSFLEQESQRMNALEEARQDKLNAQIEFNIAKDEFKKWKEVNGIKPQDEVYLELKQAVLTANDNFNKSRDIYNRLMSGNGANSAKTATILDIEPPSASVPKKQKAVSVGDSPMRSKQSSPTPRVVSTESSSNPLGQNNHSRQPTDLEQVVCSTIALGPPKVSWSMPSGDHFLVRIKVKPVLVFLCICSLLVHVDEIINGIPILGILLIIPSLVGLLAIFTSNLDYIAAYGWLKLLTMIIELIAVMTSIPYNGGPVIVGEILQLIFGYSYLYCIQKYYMSIANARNSDANESLLEEGDGLQWD